MKNVLIVDNDLGFVYWSAQALAGLNCQPWPASSAGDATSILFIRHLAPLDLLIVNPCLRGAALLISRLRRSQPNLKVLGLGLNTEKNIRGVHAWHPRPDPDDDAAQTSWLREIGRLFDSHTRAA
jgi:hypothetical protein